MGKRLSQLPPVVISLTLLCAVCRPARANPWGHEWGHGFAKVAASYFTAEESFQRGLPTGLSYDAVTVDVYAEIGLPWRMTAKLAVPYSVATNQAASGVDFRNHTFGDARFELDYRLLERWPVSVGVETKVPLYRLARDRGEAGLIEVGGVLWSAANFPDAGDGNVDLTVKAMAGTSFPVLSSWAAASVGYRKRFDIFADGLVGSLAAGCTLWQPYVGASFFTEGVVNLQDDSDPLTSATREWLYLQGELTLGGLPWAPALRLGLALGRVVVAKNSAKGTSFTTSLSYQL